MKKLIVIVKFGLLVQEITSAGGKTVWGNPADIGKVVGGETFDVVLDNNGKDLEAVRYTQDLLHQISPFYINCNV